MILLLCVAAALPGLYWEGGEETAPALKQAGVTQLYTPAAHVARWTKSGFSATEFDPVQAKGFEKLASPGARWQMDEASSTRAAWVVANGWRMRRFAGRHYYIVVQRGRAALAAAEAYANEGDVVLKIDPSDLSAYGRMLSFLRKLDQPRLPARANIAVIDDGSPLLAEVFNLLARRNLPARAVREPDPRSTLNVRIGSAQYSKSAASNPSEFANQLRRELTDARRLLRVYGSDVVLGILTGDGARARLHLINYGDRRVDGLRVRVLGEYRGARIAADGQDSVAAEDFVVAEGGAEFGLAALETYAVVDMTSK